MRTASIILLSGTLGLSGCSKVEDTRPGQPVKTRQDAFKDILREFEPMGVMLRTRAYEPVAIARMTESLLAAREAPWTHFGPDTNYPPSKAKSAVWSTPAEFEKRRAEFFAATDAIKVAAAGGQKEVVMAAYDRVHSACKDCHDQFKGR